MHLLELQAPFPKRLSQIKHQGISKWLRLPEYRVVLSHEQHAEICPDAVWKFLELGHDLSLERRKAGDE